MTAPRGGQGTAVRFGLRTPGRPGASGFGLWGAIAGVVLVGLLVGAVAWSAASGAPTPARHPNLFAGSVVLDDTRALTVVDLVDATVNVRLPGIYTQVGTDNPADIQTVPVDEGTMLVDRQDGTFNLLGHDDYLVDATGGGIGLGRLSGATGAQGFSDGADAYIVRYAPRSTVSLVDRATVTAGAQSSGRTTAKVPPRGFAGLGGPVAERAGSVTVSDGNLWTLVGNGRQCRLVESEPVASGHNGLLDRVRAHVKAGCATATVASAGSTVGLATPGHLELFGRGAPKRVTVRGTAHASELLPVSGATGGLWYLARSSAGWSVFGVSSSGASHGLHPLHGVAPADQLTPPVESNGLLYTLGRTGSGQPPLWRIDPTSGAVSTVPGAGRYPAKSVSEHANFATAEVLVDGPRVVYNNPDSALAVVVFTDGSHAPVTIDKSTAVAVSAVGPGDIDARPNPTKKTPSPKPTTAPTHPQSAPAPQPVNQQVNCANTTQTPYAPKITGITPSSESALVSWSYQLLDEQDCEPDSWSVQVTALGGVPQPAQPVQVVNGQNQLQFVGLRPAVNYKVVVTAYINRQSTPSIPATFTTSARGPDAPSSVSTTADGNGNWVVSWKPCTASDCYVPADNWTVTGTSCGSVYVGQPPSAQAPGDQDQVTIPAGSNLGASVTFSVQGSTAAGLIGPPTSDRQCTEAWQAPNPSDITLQAKAVPAGTTVTATLEVTTSAPAIEAFGSDATEFTYSVGGVTVGPTTQTTVTVPNLPAGNTYTPTVSVAPANHPSSSVTITGTPFTQTIPWPSGLAVQANATVESNPNSGQVTASFPHLPAGTFSANGGIVCGSEETAMSGSLTNGQISLNNLDLDTMGGNCSLSLTLNDTSTPNPYGVPSPPLTTAFTLGSQPSYGFAATVDPTCVTYCSPAATVADVVYTGSGQPPAGVNWTITPTGSCGNVPSVSSSTPAFPYQINLSSCADPQGAAFVVSWEYLGATNRSPVEPLQGTFGTTTTTTTPTTTPPPATLPPTLPTAPTLPVLPTPPTPAPTPPPTTAPPPSTPTTTACPATTTTSTTVPKSTTTTKTSSSTSSTTSTSTTSTTTCTQTAALVAPASGAGQAAGPSVLAAAIGGQAGGTDPAGTIVIEGAVPLAALALGSGVLRRRRVRTASRSGDRKRT